MCKLFEKSQRLMTGSEKGDQYLSSLDEVLCMWMPHYRSHCGAEGMHHAPADS